MLHEVIEEANPPRKISGFYVKAYFDEQMKLFREKGFTLISANDLAYSRIKLGRNHSVSQKGSWVREGNVYVPDRLAGKASIVLLRDSLVLDDPGTAVKAHRSGNEAKIDEEKAMGALEEAIRGSENYHVLESTGAIPSKRFGEDATAVFLFGKHAKEYGLFLKDAGINEIPLYFDGNDHINSQGPYINQLWLGWLDFDSPIGGESRSLRRQWLGSWGIISRRRRTR